MFKSFIAIIIKLLKDTFYPSDALEPEYTPSPEAELVITALQGYISEESQEYGLCMSIGWELPAPELKGFWRKNSKRLMVTWGHSTGAKDYVVPASFSDKSVVSASRAYTDYENKIDLDTEYGQLRYALALYLIEEFKKL